MDPYYGTYFKELGATRGLMTYFETVLSNLKAFPHYQSVGHLDYVCRYLPESSQTFFYDHFSDILYPQSEVSLSSSGNDYEMGNSYDPPDASLYSKCQ